MRFVGGQRKLPRRRFFDRHKSPMFEPAEANGIKSCLQTFYDERFCKWRVPDFGAVWEKNSERSKLPCTDSMSACPLPFDGEGLRNVSQINRNCHSIRRFHKRVRPKEPHSRKEPSAFPLHSAGSRSASLCFFQCPLPLLRRSVRTGYPLRH